MNNCAATETALLRAVKKCKVSKEGCERHDEINDLG